VSSNIERGGKNIRPNFNHREVEGGYGFDACTAQLMESARNVLEDIAKSQMLACDVAHAIKDMAKTLRRIDRRLAKLEEMKLAAGRRG
jgi:hypothetical protein